VVAVIIGAASQLGMLRLAVARYLDDLSAALRGELPSGPHGSETQAAAGDDSMADEDLSGIRINPGLV